MCSCETCLPISWNTVHLHFQPFQVHFLLRISFGQHRATMRYTRGYHGSVRSILTTNLERNRRSASALLHRSAGAQQWCSAHPSRHSSTNTSSLRFEGAGMTPHQTGFRALPTAGCATPRATSTTSNTTVYGRVSSRSVSRSKRGLLTSSGSVVPTEVSSGRVLVEGGVVSPRRTVPDDVPKTPYYATGEVPPPDNMVRVLLRRVESR